MPNSAPASVAVICPGNSAHGSPRSEDDERHRRQRPRGPHRLGDRPGRQAAGHNAGDEQRGDRRSEGAELPRGMAPLPILSRVHVIRNPAW
jgi:hypothetical protein